jgi:hypothetical protein
VALLTLVSVLGAAAWALAARVQPSVGPAATPVTARAGTEHAGPSRVPAASTDGVVLDPASAAERPEDLLQALSDRRARALVALDAAALGAVHAPGSPSAVSDAGLLARLRDARARWEGLRLEVAEAVHVSGDTSAAVLRARVDWTAYVVVSDGGARTHRPADAGRRLDFALVRGPQGWRLTSITNAPAT